ncbi:hypothetical protein LXA43DRAFT_1096549 [Ganoderma leucocontextum]|nr:hypothetical protein LXA43DRAFT_1096549 [Ganoderma leucocontextum]
MSSAPTLNVDVLAVACEFLTDVSDILSFALTQCSTLRPVATRWLLSMKPIDLADGASVRRFHAFLFADAPARAPHIRALDIENPPRSPLLPTLPGDSSLLRDILTSCPHLEYISVLLQDGSRMSTDDPRAIDAILAIRSLRSLSIHGSSIGALDLLREVRAPLRMLDISFRNSKISFGMLDTYTPDEETYANLRAANQRAQEIGRDGSYPPAWKKLDKVICDPRMLYVLGLRCAIRIVVLDYCSAYTQWYAGSALRENPVPRLKLSFRLSQGLNVLDGLFSPELAGMLTHLTVCLVYDNGGGPRSDPEPGTVARLRWEELLNRILSALRPLHKLAHLRIVVHSNVHHDPSFPVAYSGEFVRALRGSVFDFEKTAVLLVRPLPSLRYVFLTTSGYLADRRDTSSAPRRFWKAFERWYTPRAWRVAARGTGSIQEGEPVLIELHEDVAETIIRNEELVLSEADKASLHLNEG